MALSLDTAVLQTVVQDAEERMDDKRRMRRERVRKYLGYRYTADSTAAPEPRFQNLLAMLVNTISRFLVSSNPRCQLTTMNPALGPEAYSLEISMNRRFERMELGSTISTAVKDALLGGLGVVRVAIGGDGLNPLTETEHYAKVIDLDDLVLDLNASNWDEVSFIGNWHRLPLEYVEQNYDVGDATLTVEYDPQQTLMGSERTSSIGARGSMSKERVVDFVRVLDLYLPFHRKVITLTEQYDVIREQDWNGPDVGPYLQLAFLDGGGQLFPLSLVATVEDLEDSINELYRKLSEQAVNQKELWLAQLAGSKDTESILEAPDGSIINVQNAQQIQHLKLRGPDPGIAQLAVMWRQQFMEMWSLHQLAGVGPQTDTASQEKLLAATANSMVDGLQDHVTEFTAQIMKALTWYRWYSEEVEEVPKPIGGRTVVDTFGGRTKQGNLSDYDVLLEPFSMQRKTPQQRLATLSNVVTNVVMPMAGMMAQQGIVFSMPDFIDYLARYTGSPELLQMLKYTSPMREAMLQGPQQQTHSIYERVNRPGVNRQQQDEMIAKMMAGDAEQPAEMASVARSA